MVGWCSGGTRHGNVLETALERVGVIEVLALVGFLACEAISDCLRVNKDSRKSEEKTAVLERSTMSWLVGRFQDGLVIIYIWVVKLLFPGNGQRSGMFWNVLERGTWTEGFSVQGYWEKLERGRTCV